MMIIDARNSMRMDNIPVLPWQRRRSPSPTHLPISLNFFSLKYLCYCCVNSKMCRYIKNSKPQQTRTHYYQTGEQTCAA